MATKSIKIRNSKIFKLILVLISCCFFVGTYYYGQLLFDFFLNNQTKYGVWNLQVADTVLANGSSNFAEQIRKETNNLKTIVTYYKSDEYVESGEAQKALEASIRSKYEKNIEGEIISRKISAIEQMYIYDYQTNQYTYPTFEEQDKIVTFSSEQQIVADNSYISIGDFIFSGLTLIDGKYYYKGMPLEYIVVDEEGIRKEYTAEMQTKIIEEKGNFKANYRALKEELASLKNYKYYLVDKTTGDVYSNISGATDILSAKNVLEKDFSLENNYYAEIINGDFDISKTLSDVFTNRNTTTYYYDENDSIEFVTDGSGYYGYCFEGFDSDRYDIIVFVDLDAKENDVFKTLRNEWLSGVSNLKGNVTATVLFLILWVLSIILIVVNAGIINEDGTTKESKIDKVPNSIHFVFSFVATVTLAVVPMLVFMEYFMDGTFEPSLVVAVLSLFANLLFVEWIASISRQAKNGHYWKNTLTYKLLIKNWSKIKAWANSGINKMTHGEIKRRILFVFLAYVILVSIFSLWDIVGTILIVIASIVAAVYIVKLSKGLDAVASALTKAENGDYDFAVDVDLMPNALKPIGESVNDLTKGVNIALEDSMKSERMKTELITNVSHDLKTPLTSIVTYTDLLKRCKIEDENALSYISVLDEKSQHLKTLVEDLVEASKASSGNITLNMTALNINELTEQIFGEYEDDLKELNLELKIDIPKEPLIVCADGQKTYRIIENLFSNVRKYAMPNTRVYIEVKEVENFAILSMKNISRDEMNFDVERLTERFVQGDESRSEGGSGLGLSIAKSLTELQGGRFEISVDGDLFKVTIALPVKE